MEQPEEVKRHGTSLGLSKTIRLLVTILLNLSYLVVLPNLLPLTIKCPLNKFLTFALIPLAWNIYVLVSCLRKKDFIAGVLALSFTIVIIYGLVECGRSNRQSHSGEVKSHLGAIRSTQVAYFAEWGFYVGNQSLTPIPDRRGRKEKAAWIHTTRFSILGYAPEGKVYCSYSIEGPDYPTESQGFTAKAHCDLDGDGSVSVWTITNTSSDISHSGGMF